MGFWILKKKKKKQFNWLYALVTSACLSRLRFTSCLSFYSILNELNDYAGQREVVAEEMAHKVYGELMRYSQDLKAERKHVSGRPVAPVLSLKTRPTADKAGGSRIFTSVFLFSATRRLWRLNSGGLLVYVQARSVFRETLEALKHQLVSCAVLRSGFMTWPFDPRPFYQRYLGCHRLLDTERFASAAFNFTFCYRI